VLLQLVNSESQRVVPLLFTQFSLKDVVISDWSQKVTHSLVHATVSYRFMLTITLSLSAEILPTKFGTCKRQSVYFGAGSGNQGPHFHNS